MLVPHREDDPGYGSSRRPHPQRTLHKDRTGGDLFLFTHLTVERCPFYLFIYTHARALCALEWVEFYNKASSRVGRSIR